MVRSTGPVKAFFGRPVKGYVRGGAHVGAEIILGRGESFLALRRPKGLYGGPENALYFPHGEFLFGEQPGDCVTRLVYTQTGMKVAGYRILDLWSWMADEKHHWHLVLVVLARVKGRPSLPAEVSELVLFTLRDLPRDLAWWDPKDFVALLRRPGKKP